MAKRSLIVAAALLAAACSTPPPKPAEGPTKEPPKTGEGKPKKAGPDVMAEVGGLDQREVKKNFESLLQKVGGCQGGRRKANSKLDFLSGDVKVEVHVDTEGAVQAAFLPRSTLGDIETEKCILDAARAMSWPKPEGGRKGIASNEFSLPQQGEREAVPWSADKASGVLAKAKGALGSCKSGTKGTFEVTMYIDTDGKVISAGVSQPDPAKPGAAQCIVDAVKGLKFSSPGGWPAKVTAPVDLLDLGLDPADIGRQRRGPVDVEHDDLGQLVGVQGHQALAQAPDGALGGLDQQRHLVVDLDLALPAVDAAHGQGVDAGGEALLDEFLRDVRGLGGWAVGEDELHGAASK